MNQHTPGPWTIENHGSTYIISKPGDGYITRDVCRMDGSTMSAFAQKANAHLIAAAPDLLEALQEIISAADGDGWSQLDAGFSKARAAIARARGKTK